MTTRSRLWTSPPLGLGYAERKIGTNPPNRTYQSQNAPPFVDHYDSCQDVIGDYGKDHPLTINKYDYSEVRPLNGHLDQGGGSYIEYSNYVPSARIPAVTHLSPDILMPSIGTLATTLRARSNPSREEVSLPNFAAEIKDFPHMLRDLKNLGPLLRNLRHRHPAAISAAASQYLGYQFGWKPMISDLRNMLTFNAQVDKRIVELNRLYSSTGLKRRLNLYENVVSSERSIVFDSILGAYVYGKMFTVTRRRVWGTIRWRPTAVPRDIGHQALGREARKLVFGMDHLGFDATQAWNLIPFSWLADWFGNFGDWLAAHRNDVPAAPTGPCNIMTLTETYETWLRSDGINKIITGAEGTRVLRTKERAQSAGTLSAHLPLATARQLSILAALNLQRKKR